MNIKKQGKMSSIKFVDTVNILYQAAFQCQVIITIEHINNRLFWRDVYFSYETAPPDSTYVGSDVDLFEYLIFEGLQNNFNQQGTTY